MAIRESGAVPVLVVDRVDHGPAAEHAPGPALTTSGSVESSTSGRVAAVANRPAISVMSAHAVPADVVHAHVEQVRAVAGLLPGDLDAVVHRPASIASRNAFDPLALVRSPMARNEVSWRNGTCW